MSIDIKKWNPTNWFKHEKKEEENNLPTNQHTKDPSGGYFPSITNPLLNIHQEIDSLFDRVMSGTGNMHFPSIMGHSRQAVSNSPSDVFIKPRLDIKERKKDYQINVEIPGVEEDGINLEVSDGTLIISGEKKYEKENKDERYYSIERSYGSFRRILSLPEDANDQEIDAKFKNGVLSITIPRKEIEKQKENTRQIEIKKAA